ncbi:DUF2291 family protein [Acerihabitans arboris]|uniref:DUF2291 family protein n=1 Tax=Acerihabitans arboris TaxID=2691583 RepID=A0A845SIW6_9GAMM|nr:DUF2291 domain-containing protein [Acerihabitans arboris]NDL63302.1 DUF2291 family protein [Acerihabitans arboris]
MSTRMMLAVTASLLLGGCRIVSQQRLAELKNPPNPNMARAAALFDRHIAPEAIASAKPLGALLRQIGQAKDFADACRLYGYRSQDENPCVFTAQVSGVITGVNSQSRNGQMVVKSDDDSVGEVKVQIGPTFRGTDLRDSYRGLSYGDFNDQNLFGDFGKAINQQAIAKLANHTFKPGDSVKVYGVFSAFDQPQPPLLLTPVGIGQ